MLEYLILNGKFEAAKHYHNNSQSSLREELLSHFNKGNRVQFMDLFNMLHKQSKLEFYVRVYFLIYSIHPALRGKGSIPEPQKIAFKDYLDNKGAQLAKTNQFLQFYALPFIKKPLQHLAFKNLFKKEWVTHLKEKLQIYITDQQRILKAEVAKLFSQTPNTVSNTSQGRVLQQNVKQMQKINKKLFEQVKQFTQKYQILEDSHKTMIDGFHTHMLQSQSKWFQITKQLVDCSKTLISMLLQSNSVYLSDRRFIKIKKRTQKYQRFVNKKFDDLMNHDQDISIFDKPSINDLSYSVTPHTQKSLFANHQHHNSIIPQYVPTDYNALRVIFRKGSPTQKITVLNALYWRILKSKDKTVRKLNILGVLQHDVLGIKSGEIEEMLISRQLMKPVLRLLQLISLDNHGKRILFNKNSLHKDLIGLVSQCQDTSCLQYIIYTLGQISSQRYFKLDLINQDIIEVCMSILRSSKYEQSEIILQSTVAILLNMVERDDGLRKIEKEKDVFDVLKKYTKSKFKITKTLTYGIIFALLESQILFKKAQKQRLSQYFDNVQNVDSSVNKNQLKFLKDKLKNYQPKQINEEIDYDDIQEIDSQQDELEFEEGGYIPQLDQILRCHQQIQQKYGLKGREGAKQTQQIKQLLEQYVDNRVPRFQNLDEQNKNISKVSSPNPKASNIKLNQQSAHTPYIKQPQNKYEQPQNSQRPAIQKRMNNYFENDQKNNPKEKGRQGRVMLERQHQQIQNQQRRMQKSISADRGIGRNNQKADKFIYQSNKFTNNKVSQFNPVNQKNYRSPQQNKKSREQVLKQLNEQIKAQQMMRSKKKATTQYQRQNQAYANQKPKKPQQEGEAFQSRPKIRRTPPKQ